MKPLLIGLLRVYQVVISPPLHWLGGPAAGCRFTPTCSQYCLDAIRLHGSGYGLWLGLKRVARCHPWGGHGEDPVPPAPAGCQGERAAPPPPVSLHDSKRTANSLSTTPHSTALSPAPAAACHPPGDGAPTPHP